MSRYPVALTEPDHLSEESTNNLLQNVTRYVIPESCTNIVYSIVSAKRDTFRDASSIHPYINLYIHILVYINVQSTELS